ncbi:MAG: DUF4230 domain-containing protein [Verrucomicrobiota bacterium]
MRLRYTLPAFCLLSLIIAIIGIQVILQKISDIPTDALTATQQKTQELLSKTSELFEEILQVQPKIIMNQEVIQKQSAPITELAMIEQEFTFTYEWKHRWLTSTKKMKLTSSFRAKAGFDLQESFQLLYDQESQSVTASLPAAKLLSIEQIGMIDSHNEHGWINRIQESEREEVLNLFLQAARMHANQTDLAWQAEEQITQQLKELAQQQNIPISLNFGHIEGNLPSTKF